MTIKNTVDCVDEGCPHWGTVHAHPAPTVADLDGGFAPFCGEGRLPKHKHQWEFVGIISDPHAPYYEDEYESTAGLYECLCGATKHDQDS